MPFISTHSPDLEAAPPYPPSTCSSPPVTNPNGARRQGRPKKPGAPPRAALPLGRWRLFLERPSHHPVPTSWSHPEANASVRKSLLQSHLLLQCERLLSRQHAVLSSLGPFLHPKDHCPSVATQRGTPNLCWLLLASFNMTARSSRLPPPQALLPPEACPQRRANPQCALCSRTCSRAFHCWECPSQPSSTQPQLTVTSS